MRFDRQPRRTPAGTVASAATQGRVVLGFQDESLPVSQANSRSWSPTPVTPPHDGGDTRENDCGHPKRNEHDAPIRVPLIAIVESSSTAVNVRQPVVDRRLRSRPYVGFRRGPVVIGRGVVSVKTRRIRPRARRRKDSSGVNAWSTHRRRRQWHTHNDHQNSQRRSNKADKSSHRKLFLHRSTLSLGRQVFTNTRQSPQNDRPEATTLRSDDRPPVPL